MSLTSLFLLHTLMSECDDNMLVSMGLKFDEFDITVDFAFFDE